MWGRCATRDGLHVNFATVDRVAVAIGCQDQNVRGGREQAGWQTSACVGGRGHWVGAGQKTKRFNILQHPASTSDPSHHRQARHAIEDSRGGGGGKEHWRKGRRGKRHAGRLGDEGLTVLKGRKTDGNRQGFTQEKARNNSLAELLLHGGLSRARQLHMGRAAGRSGRAARAGVSCTVQAAAQQAQRLFTGRCSRWGGPAGPRGTDARPALRGGCNTAARPLRTGAARGPTPERQWRQSSPRRRCSGAAPGCGRSWACRRRRPAGSSSRPRR